MPRPTRAPLVSPPVREFLRTVAHVMRYLIAAAFFAVAALVVAAHLLLFKLDVGVGAGAYGWSAAVTSAAVLLGLWCLPESRALARFAGRRRRRRARRGGPGRAGAGLPSAWQQPGAWNAEAEQLERLWERPAWRPPHDYRVRPAIPPVDGEPREADPGGAS